MNGITQRLCNIKQSSETHLLPKKLEGYEGDCRRVCVIYILYLFYIALSFYMANLIPT